jgi:riboflavin synthase
MFTGIVEESGIVRSLQHGSNSSQMTIGSSIVVTDLKTGDSVCTQGVCLTVIHFTPESFTVDVMPETLRKTTLGSLKPGNHVNLERALRLSDRLGGHLVSGHIDGTGTIAKVWRDDIAIRFQISASPEILKYIIGRGSVAIDGISLTVTDVDSRYFGVSVIPHTQSVTTLTGKRQGEAVNIECDMLAKYVEKLISPDRNSSKIDMDFLLKNGYA